MAMCTKTPDEMSLFVQSQEEDMSPMFMDLSWEVVGKLLTTGFFVFLGGTPIVALWCATQRLLRGRQTGPQPV
jgi:hypothetical protein